MFALVIEMGGNPGGAEAVREAHVRYSELAAHHPGILYKHVMQTRDNPARFYDVMVWAHQKESEAFGIDPEYQKHRPQRPIKIPTGPRAGLNPGYYQEVWEHGHTTSGESTQLIGLYEATPGREREFEAAAAAARDELGDRVTSFILYRNLGKPNQYSVVVQGLAESDEGALAPLAGLTVRPPEIDRGDIIVRYDFR